MFSMASSLADWMKPQVLTMMASASAGSATVSWPSASSAWQKTSASTWFLGQPRDTMAIFIILILCVWCLLLVFRQAAGGVFFFRRKKKQESFGGWDTLVVFFISGGWPVPSSFWTPKKVAKKVPPLRLDFFRASCRGALLLSSPKEVSKKGATVSTRWTPTREQSPLDPAQQNTYRVLPPPASTRPTLRAGGVRLAAAGKWN